MADPKPVVQNNSVANKFQGLPIEELSPHPLKQFAIPKGNSRHRHSTI